MVLRQNAKYENRGKVLTAGETLPDGSLVDLIRPASDMIGLELCRWDGKEVTTAPRLEVRGIIYEPVDLGADIVRAINFPTAPLDYGTTRELFDRVTTVLAQYTGLAFEDLRLTSFFVLASWLPEFVPRPVTMLVSAQFASELPSLLRALRSLCRRGLLVGDLSIRGFCALPLKVRPTLILSQSSLSRSLAGVLRVANTGDLFIEYSGTMADPNCFMVLSAGQDGPDPQWSGQMLRVSIAPRRTDAETLDERNVREVLAQLPPQLLAYRLRNFARVDVPKLDFDFPISVREIARSLSSVIVDDDALRRELKKLLQPQAEDLRTQLITTPEFAVVVVVLAFLHKRENKFVAVNVLTTAANAVLRSFGEIIEFSAVEIGQRLAALGLYTSRTTNAKVLRLNRDTSRKAHELARRLGVPLPEGGFPDCPDCGASPKATGKSRLLQGV